MVIKAWAKFIEMDLECLCVDTKDINCSCNAECSLYVVKFTEVDNTEEITARLQKTTKAISSTTSNLVKEINKIARISKRLL